MRPLRSTTWYGSLPWAARIPARSTTSTSGWTWRAAFPSEAHTTSRASGTTVAPSRTMAKAARRAARHRFGERSSASARAPRALRRLATTTMTTVATT